MSTGKTRLVSKIPICIFSMPDFFLAKNGIGLCTVSCIIHFIKYHRRTNFNERSSQTFSWWILWSALLLKRYSPFVVFKRKYPVGKFRSWHATNSPHQNRSNLVVLVIFAGPKGTHIVTPKLLKFSPSFLGIHNHRNISTAWNNWEQFSIIDIFDECSLTFVSWCNYEIRPAMTK